MTRARRHYLWRQPGLGMPAVALALALVGIILLLLQTRAERPSLLLGTRGVGSGVATVRVEVRAADDFRVDGERLATLTDLEFRLGGRSGPDAALELHLMPGVPGDALVGVLDACSRAGFAKVALVGPDAARTPPDQ